jgi:ATP-binding cassette subfamily B protein RaxB
VIALTLPYFSKLAIDRVVPEANIDMLGLLGMGFLLLALLFGYLFFARSQVVQLSAASLGSSLTANLARRLFRLPISWFESRHVGDILARFQSLKPIRQSLTEDLAGAVLDGAMAATTLLVMFFYSPTLAAVALSGVASVALMRLTFFKSHQRKKELALVHSGREQSALIEMLRGVRSLRLSGRSAGQELRWRSRLSKAVASELDEKKLEAIQNSGKVFFERAEGILFIWISIYLVLENSLTLGSVFALSVYRTIFNTSAFSAVENIWRYKALGLHLERVADIALTPEDERYRAPLIPRRQLVGRVELRNIEFRYAPSEPLILNRLSLCVEPGECVAITGPSGQGKTTLAHIVLGLLKPEGGKLFVDGLELASFGFENFYTQVSAVLQDDELFAGSLFENISLFDDDAKLEDVQEAARMAFIAEEIEGMPMTYDTLVGDMGAALSGGQKQRVLLARAMYRKPRFMLLDEATSHLDAEGERKVNAALRNLGVTRLVLAHREETIRSADRVLVLKGGQLHAA